MCLLEIFIQEELVPTRNQFHCGSWEINDRLHGIINFLKYHLRFSEFDPALHESALQQLKAGAPPGGPGTPDDSLVSDGGGGSGSSGGKSYMKTGSLTIFSDIPKGFSSSEIEPIRLRRRCSCDESVLRFRDILVWIRIRGFVPLTNGSCSFHQWPSRWEKKFLVFLLISFWRYIYIILQR